MLWLWELCNHTALVKRQGEGKQVISVDAHGKLKQKLACIPLPLSTVQFLYWDNMEFLWPIYRHLLSTTNYPTNCCEFVWKDVLVPRNPE